MLCGVGIGYGIGWPSERQFGAHSPLGNERHQLPGLWRLAASAGGTRPEPARSALPAEERATRAGKSAGDDLGSSLVTDLSS
jgi:hypothetical protein